MLFCCGFFPVEFFFLCSRLSHPEYCIQIIASRNTLFKDRFGSVISSNGFPVKHYTGKSQQPTTPYLWCRGIGPWTEEADGHQQAVGVNLWGQIRTGNWDRKEQLCSSVSAVHKYITSLFCLNWLRCVVESSGNKLWENTAVATNPSSPSPCNAPKPELVQWPQWLPHV